MSAEGYDQAVERSMAAPPDKAVLPRVKTTPLAKTGQKEADGTALKMVGPGVPIRGEEEAEPTPFCCISCSQIFMRPPGEEHKMICVRCHEEAERGEIEELPKEEAAGSKARLRPGTDPVKVPQAPRGKGKRGLLRAPKAELGIGDKLRLKREEIEFLNARINQAVGEGDTETAERLREALAERMGHVPKAKGAPKRGR